MSANLPPDSIQRTYKQPECGRTRDDPAFNGKDDIDECDAIINKKNPNQTCGAPRWCHPSAPHSLCELSREEIKSNKAEYMTTNGLCIPCLQMKVCCLCASHSPKDSILPSLPSPHQFQEELRSIIRQEISPFIDQSSEQSKVLLKVMKISLRQRLNPWESLNSETKTQIDKNDKYHKSKVLKFYKMIKMPDSDKICMILGKVNPLSEVICAHIYPSYTMGEGLELFGLSDSKINDARNFLRLHKDIESAFDRRHLSFEIIESNGNIYLQPIIFNPKIMNKVISNENITFSQIHKRIDITKNFRFRNNRYPYRRLLAQHLRCCIDEAIILNWIDQSEHHRLNEIAFEAARESLELMDKDQHLLNNFTFA